MAYDAVNGNLLLFSGAYAIGDTWVFSVTSWKGSNATTQPPPRAESAMAYDSANSTVVMYGGIADNATYLGDTWLWNGTNWENATPSAPGSSPPARRGASMAFDPATGDAVLFGGDASGVTNQTWTWNGSTWTEEFPTTSPSPRMDSSMAYDPVTGDIVLFGGENSAMAGLSDTWLWNGSDWTEALTTGPAGRLDAPMAYDKATGEVVLFGGETAITNAGSLLDDTWDWTGSGWTEQSPSSSPPPSAGGSMTYDSATGSMLLFGGSTAYQGNGLINSVWGWNGANWMLQSPTTSPPARLDASMTFDESKNRIVLFGGDPGSSAETGQLLGPFLGDTWTYFTPAPPSGPVITSVTTSGQSATVDWSVPRDSGSSSIGSYLVTRYVGGSAQTPVSVGNVSSTTIDNLLPSTAYTFTVTAENGEGAGPASQPSAPVTTMGLPSPGWSLPSPDGNGYWLVASDGGIFAYGDAGFYGSAGAMALNKPIVGMATTPDGKGYWLVASDGGIFAYGDAGFYGSTGSLTLNKPIVGMATTPDGKGYWLVASDGGIFAYGDAGFYGSTGSLTLNKPIVGMATTPDGKGYWLVASDGGIFAYGDAGFYGSTGSLTLNKPIVGMATTPDGKGYWLVASDGGIFAYGDAGFYGSTGSLTLNKPIVGMATTPDGKGYWLVASDGGIFAYGDGGFYGSAGAMALNKPIVGLAGA